MTNQLPLFQPPKTRDSLSNGTCPACCGDPAGEILVTFHRTDLDFLLLRRSD